MPEQNAVIHVVDDDASTRQSLGAACCVRSAFRFALSLAPASSCIASFQTRQAVWYWTYELPGLGGLDLQNRLSRAEIGIPIIFITGHGDIPMTVHAMKAGAVEFLTKRFRDQDLLDAIQQTNRSGQSRSQRPD